jgi:hypothetical protein
VGKFSRPPDVRDGSAIALRDHGDFTGETANGWGPGVAKAAILRARREGTETRHWQLAFGKRPADALYDLKKNPDCPHNLARDPKHNARKAGFKGNARATTRPFHQNRGFSLPGKEPSGS